MDPNRTHNNFQTLASTKKMQRSADNTHMIFTKDAYKNAASTPRVFNPASFQMDFCAHLTACYKACGSPQGVDLVRWIVTFVKLFIVQGDETLKTTIMVDCIRLLLGKSSQWNFFFLSSHELNSVMPEGYNKDEIFAKISKTQHDLNAITAAGVAGAIYGERYIGNIQLRDVSFASFDYNDRFLTSALLEIYLLLNKTKCFGQQWQKTCVKEKHEGYTGKLAIPLLEHVVAAFTPSPVHEVLDSEDEQPAPKKPRFVRDDTVFEIHHFDPQMASHNEGDDF
jgi:hypothetical protein